MLVTKIFIAINCNMLCSFYISICNKWYFIALQFICNKPEIHWTMSDYDEILIFNF